MSFKRSTLGIPRFKLATRFQSPRWRYDAIENPTFFLNLDQRQFTREENGGACLRRFLVNPNQKTAVIRGGLDKYSVRGKLPVRLSRLVDRLPRGLSPCFFKLYRKYLKENNIQMLVVEPRDRDNRLLPVFNLKDIKRIDDEWVKKLIEHVSMVEFYSEIDWALNLSMSEQFNLIFRTLGYYFYAGFDDTKIAWEWGTSKKNIQALRHIFYDFSVLPRGRIPQLITLTNLSEQGVISENDFHFYKRIFDLGKAGLQAYFDVQSLSDEQQLYIRSFIRSSSLENSLNFKYALSNMKDCVGYNDFLMKLHRIDIHKEELDLVRQRTRLLEKQVEAIDIDGVIQDDLTEKDRLLLEKVQNLFIKDENSLEFPSLSELE